MREAIPNLEIEANTRRFSMCNYSGPVLWCDNVFIVHNLKSLWPIFPEVRYKCLSAINPQARFCNQRCHPQTTIDIDQAEMTKGENFHQRQADSMIELLNFQGSAQK